MNKMKYIALLGAALLGLSACSEFGDLNVDKNNTSNLDTRFLLLGAEGQTPTFSVNDTYNLWTQLTPCYLSEWNNIQFTKFRILELGTGDIYRKGIGNCELIIKMASDETAKGVVWLGNPVNQVAVAETLRAYFYMHLTDALGSLPYSEALKGDEGLFTPKYDTQEFIYTDLDKRLTEAYKMFEEGKNLNPNFDVMYKGDIAKWKKLNASLRMMMAIKLSDVAPEVGKMRFAKAYADGGISTNDANFAFPYLLENDYANPIYKNAVVQGRRDYQPSNIIIDKLNELEDPRVATIALPSVIVKDEDENYKSGGIFEGYVFGLSSEEAGKLMGTKSHFNPNYLKANTPLELVTAGHIKLIEAEAALRSWITADAQALYEEGVKLSFEDFGVAKAKYDNVIEEVVNKLKANEDVATYLAQEKVTFTGTTEEKLQKIAVQRWINNFMRNGVEAWSDWRRLGFPKEIKPGQVAPDLEGMMPYRRLYDSDDFSANRAEYDKATNGGEDDKVTTRVWWDTKDNN